MKMMKNLLLVLIFLIVKVEGGPPQSPLPLTLVPTAAPSLYAPPTPTTNSPTYLPVDELVELCGHEDSLQDVIVSVNDANAVSDNEIVELFTSSVNYPTENECDPIVTGATVLRRIFGRRSLQEDKSVNEVVGDAIVLAAEVVSQDPSKTIFELGRDEEVVETGLSNNNFNFTVAQIGAVVSTSEAPSPESSASVTNSEMPTPESTDTATVTLSESPTPQSSGVST